MQRDATKNAPTLGDLEAVGCLAGVVRMHRKAEGKANVLLHGLRRVRLLEATPADFLRARIEPVEETEPEPLEAEALLRVARDQLKRLKALVPVVPSEALKAARQLTTPGALADVIASFIEMKPQQAQDLLGQPDGGARLHVVIELLERELQTLAIADQIREQAQKALGERNTEAILKQQLEVIKQRLGEDDQDRRELDALRERLAALGLPDDARAEVERELGRLARLPIQSSEYSVVRTYLDTLAELPWSTLTEDRLDLAHATAVLDEDHFGLDEVKDRILEFLAVHRFRTDAPAPTLCFVGPPGTGKTSLGRSIARALGRAYVRQSLGGVHDEAEIRGHRRTYVGAMPGRIVSALRRAGTRNPVMVLDEVDKIGAHGRGDPHSALLEVLDPEQNRAFVDHYVGVPFDLSRVMFICTANVAEAIPVALRDRMELVELSGYTPAEKREIAKRHIVPRELDVLGLAQQGLSIEDDALDLLVRGYTREAGVRELDRKIASLLRKTARHLAETDRPVRRIDAARVRELLGHPKYLEPDLPPLDEPGCALGLAWTPVGGEVLVIEAVARPGKDGLLLTGQLGDVMKESATAALSFLRSHAAALHAERALEEGSIHLHVPAGAIPKDGPSAGVAMFVALTSLCTGRRPVEGVAMTGEITLRGRVLPVGGIAEKILGAHRAGIRTVILPRRNEHDLDDVPKEVREQMRFVLIDHASEALAVALHDGVVQLRRGAENHQHAAP